MFVKFKHSSYSLVPEPIPSVSMMLQNKHQSFILHNNILLLGTCDQYESEYLYYCQNGWTALFHAADRGYVDVAELLMEHGVELELKNKVLAK